MKLKSLLLGAVALTALAPAAIAERGSDGHVNVIYWQAPSILNPYLSSGTKDIESSSLVIEPLGRFVRIGFGCRGKAGQLGCRVDVRGGELVPSLR